MALGGVGGHVGGCVGGVGAGRAVALVAFFAACVGAWSAWLAFTVAASPLFLGIVSIKEVGPKSSPLLFDKEVG